LNSILFTNGKYIPLYNYLSKGEKKMTNKQQWDNNDCIDDMLLTYFVNVKDYLPIEKQNEMLRVIDNIILLNNKKNTAKEN